MKQKRKLGKVWLVGAGPGDPGLLTRKGARLLELADVVLYDALVNPSSLVFASKAKLIAVGKRAGGKVTPQDVTTRLMIRHAKLGREVVRLKGGDPFLFGRGGEEAEALARAGVKYEVVPGVSSALAGPAAAGIPLTHRRDAASVVIATGRTSGDATRPDVDWEGLARSADTLVIMMATWHIKEIARRMIAAGRHANTPVTAVRWATWPMQEIVRATLATAAVKFSHLTPPTVIVVGNVAALGSDVGTRVSQFSLKGIQVAVTREHGEGRELPAILQREGALVWPCPAIRTTWWSADATARNILRDISTFDWIVFTSVNAVHAFMSMMRHARIDARKFPNAKIGAIGSRTADELDSFYQLRPNLVPRDSTAEGLLRAMGNVRAKKILFPRAAVARDVLPRGLEQGGAQVTVLPVYSTGPDREGLSRLKDLVCGGSINLVTFTSGSTVDFSMRALGASGRRAFKRSVLAASIGRVTSASLKKWGIKPAMQAKQASMAGLAAAIVSYYRKHPHGH